MTLQGWYYYHPHFTDGRKEAQIGQVTHPRSQSRKREIQNSKPESLFSEHILVAYKLLCLLDRLVKCSLAANRHKLPDSDEIFNREFIKRHMPLAKTLALSRDSLLFLKIRKAVVERPAGFVNIKIHIVFKLFDKESDS